MTENIYNLAEKLAHVTPGRLQKSFFCSTGTEANEGAVLLANIYNQKSELLALRNGLHWNKTYYEFNWYRYVAY